MPSPAKTMSSPPPDLPPLSPEEAAHLQHARTVIAQAVAAAGGALAF
ncbi:MAG: hypothetical protein RLZ44_1788, partial [Pseudomonadota bacterium]